VSNCYASCVRCGWFGTRSKTYKEKPEELPSFHDQCPNCRSSDIEVLSRLAFTEQEWQRLKMAS